MRILFWILFSLVVGSYWFVQVVEGDYYRELAENNRIRTLPIKAPRGLIYDRAGRLLVENVPSYDLLLDRTRSPNLETSLLFASEVLGKPVADFEEALAKGSASRFKPTLIAENLSLSQVARLSVSGLEFPEFEIDVGHLRLYRYGPITSHSVGHLGAVTEKDLQRPGNTYGPDELIGKKGVEESFDETLRGTDGERIVIVDSRGREREEAGTSPVHPGESLELTLDLELQQAAARFFEGKEGATVAMDPATGEVLVLISSPSFNPNLFARRLEAEAWKELVENPAHPLQDRALQSAYSPGSIFKIVLAVAGLSEQIVTLQDRTYCGGSARIYNRRFRCWKRAGHGWMNLHDAIRESCDVYFYHLGQKLGIQRIADYARRLGFGHKTGFDIRGERAGLVPDPEWSLSRRGTPWYPGETISVAIGQGPLLVTPLQMATFIATLANGGFQATPHLLKKDSPQPLVRAKVDPHALEVVRRALWAVVNEKGTGARARVDGLEVSGKTSTVQVVSQKTWIDSADLPYEQRDHAWFASFASLGDRKLAVAVFVEHGGKGSQAAAPLAKILYEIYFREHLATKRPV